MKQQHTLTYIISSLMMLIFCVSVNAQNDSIPSTVKDTLIIKEKYGLRVGADLSKIARSFFEEDYSGFEITADFRLKKKMYLAAEIGFDEKTSINDYLDITSKGTYLKAGVDFNLYQNWLDMDNMVYTGFRVGASSFSQNLNSYTIYNTDQYWSPQFTSNDLQEFDGLTAFWVELIIGLKAELFNNLYLGLNVQLKMMANESEPDNFGNVFIPGFNKTFDSSRIGVGYGYTLSYRLPLYQKDK